MLKWLRAAALWLAVSMPMAFGATTLLADYVLETASAPGTAATVNLAGAPGGRVTFASIFPAGGTPVFYFITDGAQAEWAIGTFTAGSPNTLTRPGTVHNTAGTTSRLNFAGTVQVYNEVPAQWAAFFNANGDLIRDDGSAVLAGSPATFGYVILGPIVIQWGIASSVATHVVFSPAFSAAPYYVGATATGVTGFAQLFTINMNAESSTSADFIVADNAGNSASSAVPFQWIAVGPR